MKKPKCEDIGFEHNWKDTTQPITYATFPPTFPPQSRKCTNCGKSETLVIIQKEIKEWQEDN